VENITRSAPSLSQGEPQRGVIEEARGRDEEVGLEVIEQRLGQLDAAVG
jgi:hypothetical protein